MTKDSEWKQAERQRKQAAGLVRVTVDEWVPSDRAEEYRKAAGRLKRLAERIRNAPEPESCKHARRPPPDPDDEGPSAGLDQAKAGKWRAPR